MMSLAFAVWIFCYAVICFNCATPHYDMHFGSLILEFVLLFFFCVCVCVFFVVVFFVCFLFLPLSLPRPLLQLEIPLLLLLVPIILVRWRCGRSFVLSRKRPPDLGSYRKKSASVLVTRRSDRRVDWFPC